MTPAEQLLFSIAGSAAASFLGGFIGAWVRLARLEQRVQMDEERIARLEAVLDRMMLDDRGRNLEGP